ncbi:MAG TPA: sugar ABC transporter ATP-binding protein [Fimbriimonadaceae bacterium]|jgi:ribose transport system ATP-binding protein
MPLLEVRNLQKAFRATKAVTDASFSVEPGECRALVGENGCGKSTVVRMLHGEIKPDAGQMLIEGKETSPRNPVEAMASGVALVHQELAVCPHLTVLENIFLGAELKKGLQLDYAKMRGIAQECLARLGKSDLSPDALVRDLSSHERQLVEIARALRSNARIILFDEPTSSLDRKDVEALFIVIKKLREEGRAILYISHFLDEIMEICDAATIMRDGVTVADVEIANTDAGQIANQMAGTEVNIEAHHRQSGSQEVVLKAENLRGKRVPKGISIELRKGEVLGIAGLNASGRTETLRALFGLDKAQMSAEKGLAKNPTDSWKQKNGFVSEDRKGEGLALSLSLAENLTLPRPGKKGVVRDQERGHRTQKAIDALSVRASSPWQAIHELSGGNQQKIAIGRLLDSDSEILMLDEPTRGIDIRSKGVIYKAISDLADQGKSILLVSSQLNELLALSDRIIVLRRGEIVATLDAKGTTEQEIMGWCTGA